MVQQTRNSTTLLDLPRVTVTMRPVYRVEWKWTDSEDATARHRKNYLTKRAAYLHAAWGIIINRRAATTGCDRNQCKVGSYSEDQYGRVTDTRCRYCREDTYLIAERVARMLMRMDQSLVWYCDRCGTPEPAQPEYARGDCEPCCLCEDGTARVMTRAEAAAKATRRRRTP